LTAKEEKNPRRRKKDRGQLPRGGGVNCTKHTASENRKKTESGRTRAKKHPSFSRKRNANPRRRTIQGFGPPKKKKKRKFAKEGEKKRDGGVCIHSAKQIKEESDPSQQFGGGKKWVWGTPGGKVRTGFPLSRKISLKLRNPTKSKTLQAFYGSCSEKSKRSSEKKKKRLKKS